MPPPVLRERLVSYLPFIVVAVAGQLSVAWPPGPVDHGAYVASTLLLLLICALIVVRRGTLPRTFVVGTALYTSSVAFLMLASGGMGGGLGVLLFMPVVGVALYGKRWESVVSVAFILVAILAVTLASTPDLLGTTPRRLFLTGAIAAMLSVAIHVLRGRLIESSLRTARLLRHEEALNAAARQLVQLSEPPQITTLGAQLAMLIASPPGSEILRASYFRIEDGMVVIDAQFDQLGTNLQAGWPLHMHPGLREAVDTLQPVAARIDRPPPGRRYLRRSTPRASPTASGSRSAPMGSCTACWGSPAGAPPFRTSASSGASPWATSSSSPSPIGPPTAR
jgi:hypothetical protein